jgi:hypothetical protein
MGLSGTSWRATSNQLVVKEGGGCLGVFGLPFLAAGIFLVLAAVGIVPMKNAAEVPGWAWPVMAGMGLVFVGVGGGLAFGRRWVTVDSGRNLVLSQWGPLVPLRTQEHRLEGFEEVRLVLRPGDADSSDHYDVILWPRGGGKEVPLSSSALYGESRELAAAVAKFTGFPLMDASTPGGERISPEEVDLPFRDRVPGATGGSLPAPRPMRMQSQVRESFRGVEIFLPQPSFRLRKLLGPGIAIGVLVLFGRPLLQFFRETDTPAVVQMVFLGFLAFLFLVLPLLSILHGVLLSARGGTLVTVSREGITLEERGAYGRKVTRIPAADILGVDHGALHAILSSARRETEERLLGSRRTPPGTTADTSEPGWMRVLKPLVSGRGVMVKTRKDVVTFGAGLTDDEVRYLHAAVAKALKGGG